MDVATITQFIGSLGFPIVACCAMFYMYDKQVKLHQAETEKFTEAINNNTLAIEQLTAFIKERL